MTALLLSAVLVFQVDRVKVADLIREAADKHHVDVKRALALGWAESRFYDIVRIEKNGLRSCGPMQAHEKSFPGICEATLQQKVEAGMKYFAELVRKHGTAAEYWYIHGHGAK